MLIISMPHAATPSISPLNLTSQSHLSSYHYSLLATRYSSTTTILTILIILTILTILTRTLGLYTRTLVHLINLPVTLLAFFSLELLSTAALILLLYHLNLSTHRNTTSNSQLGTCIISPPPDSRLIRSFCHDNDDIAYDSLFLPPVKIRSVLPALSLYSEIPPFWNRLPRN